MRWVYAGVLALSAAVTATSAHAELVRAASNGPAIAMSLDGDDRFEPWIVVSADGVRFDRVAFPGSRWVLDLHVLDDGTVLVASGDVPRGGEIRLARILAGSTSVTSETVIAGSESMSDARFAPSASRLALVSASGAFVSRDHGLTFAHAATWDTDGYGFYAASAVTSPGGALDVLVPTFNTCSSSDWLEDLTRVRLEADGRVESAHLSFDGLGRPVGAFVGRFGALYTAHDHAGTCVLRTGAGSSAIDLDRQSGVACTLLSSANDRFVVAAFGRRILRLRGPHAVPIGALRDAHTFHDLYPDSRGRALVLMDDGQLLRFAHGEPPAVLFTR